MKNINDMRFPVMRSLPLAATHIAVRPTAGVRRFAAMSLAVIGLVAVLTAGAVNSVQAQPFNVPDRDPKVNIRFDRYYDYPAMVEALRKLEAAYPKFLKMTSIGKSYQNRDLWLITINNPDTGPDSTKRAFWVDGNIHGNEIQGVEVNLYLIWFLMENYATLPKVKELVDARAFYVLPTMNPDGRQYWFETGGPSRSSMRPWDSDGDGRSGEDEPFDLDGDRNIVGMRKHVPGEGTHVISPVDPRLLVVAPRGTRGDYILLGQEAVDRDGDGRRGEDSPGGIDMNRNFPSEWQPAYVQGGAHWYPFSHPETRAVGDFIKARRNIAGVQSWHNSGGMILRGPGSTYYKGTGDYPPRDAQTYDWLGERGALMLPYYRYMTVWKDLYTVYGGFLDWTHDALGIFSFTNELWSTRQLYSEAWTADSPIPNAQRDLFFNDNLGMGSWFVDWKEVDHPEYGKVEVGGWSKWFNRVNPPFMLQELAHRNTMFALFHADQMPLLEIEEVKVERLTGSTFRVTATAKNMRAIPSRTQAAEINRVGSPDYFTISGGRGVNVQAGGVVTSTHPPQMRMQEGDPASVEFTQGVPGFGSVSASWIVSGSGQITVRFDSYKGGTVSRTADLR